jgi:hypothetical protein
MPVERAALPLPVDFNASPHYHTEDAIPREGLE